MCRVNYTHIFKKNQTNTVRGPKTCEHKHVFLHNCILWFVTTWRKHARISRLSSLRGTERKKGSVHGLDRLKGNAKNRQRRPDSERKWGMIRPPEDEKQQGNREEEQVGRECGQSHMSEHNQGFPFKSCASWDVLSSLSIRQVIRGINVLWQVKSRERPMLFK